MGPVKTATGGITTSNKPRFLVLTAQELDDREETKSLRDYIKLDRIRFEIGPDGKFANVPVQEECRALCDLENFDVLFDLTMQYLVGKDLAIYIVNDDRSETELGRMHITSKNDDLRFMQCVVDYPWLVYWLTEFVAGHLSKKFPLPGRIPDPQVAKKKRGKIVEPPKH